MPDCECHGYAMWWHKDPRDPRGGYWRCRIRKRELDAANYRKRYRENPIFWVKQQISKARYKREERIKQDELSHS